MSARVTRDGAVATVVLDRPESLNALDLPLRQELLAALTELGADPTVSVVVLTGAGRAFCVGQDLAREEELVDAAATVRDSYNPIAEAMVGLRQPIIAAVNGPAVGAGLGLVLASDVRIMSEKAYVSCAFSKVALVPDTGTTIGLQRLMGHARAFEAAASGRRIDPAECLAIGLANEIVPSDRLLAVARERAIELAAGAGGALARTKRLLRSVDRDSFSRVLDEEATDQGVSAADTDHLEGRTAFSERRPPVFKQ